MITGTLLFIFLIALIIGMVASVFGLGGGTMNVPVLVLIFSFDQITAIGISLLTGVVISFTAMANYAWQERILYKTALLLAVPAIIFSITSVLISVYLSNTALTIAFIIVILVAAITMIRPDLITLPRINRGPEYTDGCNDRYGEKYSGNFHAMHMVAWGSVGGMTNGFTGLGGGSINVPAMIASRVPPHYATATSTLAVFIASLAASATHLGLGTIPSTGFMELYLAGAGCGAVAGTMIARRLKGSQISFGFGVYLIIVCILMGLKLITG